MTSAMVMCLRPCASANRFTSAPRITVPSSFISSASTPTNGKPARQQRKHVAGANEVSSAAVGIGKRSHRVGALLRRNPGGEPMAYVDGDREGGTERCIVQRHHGIEMQPLGLLRRQRRAHEARRVADDEGHLLGCAQGGGNEQITLVLAIIVVGHNDDLAPPEGGGDLLHEQLR